MCRIARRIAQLPKQSLTELHLSQSADVDLEGVTALRTLTTLRKLRIQATSIHEQRDLLMTEQRDPYEWASWRLKELTGLDLRIGVQASETGPSAEGAWASRRLQRCNECLECCGVCGA